MWLQNYEKKSEFTKNEQIKPSFSHFHTDCLLIGLERTMHKEDYQQTNSRSEVSSHYILRRIFLLLNLQTEVKLRGLQDYCFCKPSTFLCYPKRIRIVLEILKYIYRTHSHHCVKTETERIQTSTLQPSINQTIIALRQKHALNRTSIKHYLGFN